MRVLSPADALFLYSETPEQHQHVMGVMLLDPAGAADDFSVEKIVERSRKLTLELESYRQKLVDSPLRISNPMLVGDPDFDFDGHVHHIAVPAPGTQEQLTKIVAGISGRPLDRSRPLWETWFVTGLENGMVAMVSKCHHCLIDGVGGAEMMTKLLDLEPNPSREGREADAAEPLLPPPPSSLALLREAIRRRPGRDFGDTSRVLVKTVRSVLNKRAARRDSGDPDLVPGFMGDAPKLAMNGKISSSRNVALGRLPLSEVRSVKNRFGVTVNDIILAVCSLGLNRYLALHDDLPEKPLVALVPVSLALNESRGATDGDAGNRVGVMNVKLPVRETEPEALARQVNEYASASKRMFERSFEDLVNAYLAILPPRLSAFGIRNLTGVLQANYPIGNVSISNIPGSPVPLYLCGAKVAANYPLGPVQDGIGVSITFLSYMDTIDFSVHACRRKVSDPAKLVESIERAMTEFVAAAAVAKPPGKSAAGPKKSGGSKKSGGKTTGAGKRKAGTGKAAPGKAGATKRKAVATGSKAGATRRKAVATGNKASATRRKAEATGNKAGATRRKAVAAGNKAGATRRKAVAAGGKAGATRRKAEATGNKAGATRRKAVATGSKAGTTRRKAEATGSKAGATRRKAGATGSRAGTTERKAVATGSKAGASGHGTGATGSKAAATRSGARAGKTVAVKPKSAAANSEPDRKSAR